jgi:Zn(II)-responsive transcriptional regulator
MTRLTIGTLADVSGVGVETVRFYQRKGLVRTPVALTGFRTYVEDDAKRIRFIKRAQELGFTLREIKGLLALNVAPRATCADVKGHTDAKLNEIDRKIRDLRKMKRSLARLSAACAGGKRAIAECRIAHCLEPNNRCT